MNRKALIIDELKRIDGHSPGAGLYKHKKMCSSPFVFYRGSAQIFYADLASGRLSVPSLEGIPKTTIMGDCHTSNFGLFTEEGSFDERLVFSINDFDDACIGHGLWDIMRLLTSILLVAKHCAGVVSGAFESEKDYSKRSFVSLTQAIEASQALLDSYIEILEKAVTEYLQPSRPLTSLDEPGFLYETFADFETDSPLKKRYNKALQVVRGGEKFADKSSLAKAADITTFPLKFKRDEKKFVRLSDSTQAQLYETLSPYFYHQILDIVGRVGAGTGSVNMSRYYAIVGPRFKEGETALVHSYVVEIKQQREAAPIYYFPNFHPQNTLDPAHLTVKCQRRMQRRADYVLDHAVFDNNHWLIRSRHHARVGIDPEHIGIGKVNTQKGGLSFYANACGQELARAHCRADRYTMDYEKGMLAYLNQHAKTLIDTSIEYAEQVEEDWRTLQALEG